MDVLDVNDGYQDYGPVSKGHGRVALAAPYPTQVVKVVSLSQKLAGSKMSFFKARPARLARLVEKSSSA